jgi:hypothetical protein
MTMAAMAADVPTGFAGVSVGTMAGAAGGAAAGFAAGGIMGGNIESAVYGAFSGAAFGGLNGFYGDAWSVGRVAANSAMGGTISRAMGGNFEAGAKFALISSLAQWGFQGMADATDRVKRNECPPMATCAYNDHGLDVIGTRSVRASPALAQSDYWTEHPWEAAFAGANGQGLTMCGEGSQCHLYNSLPAPFGQAVEYGVHLTSKVHDFGNSWNYDWATGLRIEGGQWANASAAAAARFEISVNAYSFATMLPAAAYALGANASPYFLPYYAGR